MSQAAKNPQAICILGMHRSGTSTVARTINLLDVHLGEASKMMPPTQDNPEGYWEHMEIHNLHTKLMERLGHTWDTVVPLPEQWSESEEARPFKEKLARVISSNFGGHALWAWKEPQTCLLLPVWREVLERSGTKLSCLFVVRNPIDVATSIMRRDGIPFNQALGIWLHYNLAGLKGAASLPCAFLSYDRLLEGWEPELRRCATALGLAWPKNEPQHRDIMNGFIQPGLRRNQSSPERLKEMPRPVQDLYQILLDASTQPAKHDKYFDEMVDRLSREFHEYSLFFQKYSLFFQKYSLFFQKYPLFFQKGSGAVNFDLAAAFVTGKELQHGVCTNDFRHRLFGKKMRSSIRKRLAKAYCWFYP